MTTAEDLEALVGTRPLAMLMKTVDALDDGCRLVVANAPVAGFGFQDATGLPTTTVVGGGPGFVRVESPTRISFDFPSHRPSPAVGSGASMVCLLPGIGETLRLAGRVAERSDVTVALDLEEAWVHCAKCILRSGLWGAGEPAPVPVIEWSPVSDGDGLGPLASAEVLSFLQASPFVLISSCDAAGASDTSPRGDRPGFIQILDTHTLAIPDRKGNRRTDTFHNLLECNQVSLAAVVQQRDEVLHLRGTASVTDDAMLLSSMALGERPPHAALIVRVTSAELIANEALRASRLWDSSAHVHASGVPDLMQLGAQHLARSKARGAKAVLTRTVSKGLAASPGVLRRGVDRGYRRELEDEGY